MLKHLILGFIVKAVTGFDDTMVQIPIIATVTKTKRGRIAFSLGMLVAVSFAVLLAILFSRLIKTFTYFRPITAGLIFILAVVIYLDLFVHDPRNKAEKQVQKFRKISNKRFLKLIGIGFIAAFATVLDDTIAFSSLFLTNNFIFPAIGIILAAITEILVIIYFSAKLKAIKHKREITSAGLVILSSLILLGVL